MNEMVVPCPECDGHGEHATTHPAITTTCLACHGSGASRVLTVNALASDIHAAMPKSFGDLEAMLLSSLLARRLVASGWGRIG